MAKKETKTPAVIVPPAPTPARPASDSEPTAPYPVGYSVGVHPESETPVAVVLQPGASVGPHPLVEENARLRARVAALEAVLHECARQGIDYTKVHNVLHGK